jgi:hypothetical protein
LGVGFWLLVRFQLFDFLRQSTMSAIAYSLAFSSLWTLAIATIYLYIAHDLFPNPRTLAASALSGLFNTRPAEPAK